MARSDKGTGAGAPAAKNPTGKAASKAGARPKGTARADAAPVKLSPEAKKAAKKLKKEEKRGRFSRRLLKISFLRRRYVKRILRSIEKSKAKGKRMPPELYELSKRLDRVPRAKHAEYLEEAFANGPEAQADAGRAMRRAAANQERLSGRGGGRYRPGMGPMPPGARRGKPR